MKLLKLLAYAMIAYVTYELCRGFMRGTATAGAGVGGGEGQVGSRSLRRAQ